jgi:hypothetical protein
MLKIDFKELGWKVVVWTHLAQDGDQWWVHEEMVTNLWIPYFWII